MDDRTSLIKKNILFSFLIKGWGAAVIYLLVPITLHCLGEYRNGVWLTISTLLLWIDQMDAGLGNGLRNKLATYVAENNYEKAREVVSSAFVMITCIILPITILLCILINTADVYAFFNVDPSIIEDLKTTLSCATILVCSTFVFKFIGNFYMGLQLPAVNNLLVVSGQTLSLIATVLIYYSGAHSLLYIAVANTLPPLIVYIICYYLTFSIKYKEFRPSLKFANCQSAKELLSFGIKFFVLQMSGGILLMSSNILISQLFSPDVVTPYQITYRYFSILLLIFTIICTPFWTATTDAYKKGDSEWLKRSNTFLNRLILAIFVGLVIMIVISPVFYHFWIGDETTIPTEMTIMMAAFMGIMMWSVRYSYILNGFGVLSLQLILTVSAAIAFIPLAIWVSKETKSMTLFMAVMCCVNIPGLIVNMIQYKRIINKTATGIWKK